MILIFTYGVFSPRLFMNNSKIKMQNSKRRFPGFEFLLLNFDFLLY